MNGKRREWGGNTHTHTHIQKKEERRTTTFPSIMHAGVLASDDENLILPVSFWHHYRDESTHTHTHTPVDTQAHAHIHTHISALLIERIKHFHPLNFRLGSFFFVFG